jgi:RNA polymerase sigma-70 factor, ECF subfamily
MISEIANLYDGHAPSHRAVVWSRAAAKQCSDAELIERIAAGNGLAMQVLYLRHNVRLFRFIRRFVADAGAAEDLVSEVFLDVWHKARSFEGRSQVLTWLLAIAHNKALSELRHRSAEPLDPDAAALIEDPSDDPETAVQRKDRAATLRRCLARLSPAHREVIDLVYYHQRSVAEVADILGAPQVTVKTRMFYARKRLAQLLADEGIRTTAAA